ncbi:MAG: hypothetical protein R3Y53_11305 [Bacillota bacterium]
MKEERMAILDMLNRGVITATEAKELLKTLQRYEKNQRSATDIKKEFSEKVNEALDKAEDVFETIIDKVEDQYDKVEPTIKKTYNKVQPKVKDIADVVVEKVEDMEPLIKGTVSYFSSVIGDMKSEINEVRKKHAEKKDEKMGDVFDGDAEEVEEDIEEFELGKETDDSFDDLDFSFVYTEDAKDQEEADPSAENEDMSEVLNTLSSQLGELNDAESFLRNAFGEDVFDYDEDLDDEEE